MPKKRLTYGDIIQLLEAEGFSPTAAKGDHVRFDRAANHAAVVLPDRKSSTAASSLDIELVRRTLVDFGVMGESEFERWIADPKRFQAA